MILREGLTFCGTDASDRLCMLWRVKMG